MSIYHNGKEYGATKVINYSASPDYNRGVTVDNIQTGNYQATDNGFLMIQLQSQQSNPTKVSVVRNTAPITDTGTEIASIVISQYQYSETLVAQVMARDYYKLVIEGAGNSQVISCMFYPYASNVPIKLIESISMEQVEGLENELDGKQDVGNYFNKDTDVLGIAHGGHGGTTVEKAQTNLRINDFNRNNYERVDLNKAKNGVVVCRKDYLTNAPSSDLSNSGEILIETILGQSSTTFSDNNAYTYNLQIYKERNSHLVLERICKPNGVVGEWKLLRKADGSIPADLISPTVLKYENSDGIWTETKLTTGEVMLEGYGLIDLSASSPSSGSVSDKVSLPKTIKNSGKVISSIVYNRGQLNFTFANSTSTYFTIGIANNVPNVAMEARIAWYFRGILA